MIDAGRKRETAWNAVFILSLAAIAIGAWYGFIQPKISSGPISPTNDLSAIQNATRKVDQLTAADLSKVKGQTWDMTANALGSHTLETIAQLADKSHIQLSGFRLDKPVRMGRLTEVPFLATVQGGFPEVMSVVQSLEDPKSKLMVKLLQISAADAGSDRVSASIGLAGFLWTGDK